MEKEKFLVNNDDEIKVNVLHDDVENIDYSDDFYDDGGCHCEECSCDNCQCDEDCCCDGECTCDKCSCECCGCDTLCEENLDEELIDDFEPQVVERGENYYQDGRVLEVLKSRNHYYAKVKGSKKDAYEVEIILDSDGIADYTCTCPYEYNCKHAYATLIAIANGEYSEIELKPYKMPKYANLYEIFKKIPAEELKAYLLSDEGMDNVCVKMEPFNSYFRKYFPRQDYEFYYNKLYNEIMLHKCFLNTVDEYLKKVRDYLQGDCFEEAFDIVKSIIEALHDGNVLNTYDEVFDVISKVEMLLRIIYRKGYNVQNSIKEWLNILKVKNYYHNYYLEDIVLTIK